MHFLNTALPGDNDPDALGLISTAITIGALTVFPEPEFSPWLGLSIVGAVLLVNLVVRGVTRWWRNGKRAVDAIFDKELS